MTSNDARKDDCHWWSKFHEKNVHSGVSEQHRNPASYTPSRCSCVCTFPASVSHPDMWCKACLFYMCLLRCLHCTDEARIGRNSSPGLNIWLHNSDAHRFLQPNNYNYDPSNVVVQANLSKRWMDLPMHVFSLIPTLPGRMAFKIGSVSDCRICPSLRWRALSLCSRVSSELCGVPDIASHSRMQPEKTQRIGQFKFPNCKTCWAQ